MFDRSWLLIWALVIAVSAPSSAHDYAVGQISVGHPWARPTIIVGRPLAVYLELSNSATEDDRLIGASVSLAERVEIHQSVVSNNVMHMKEAPEGLALPAAAAVVFEPGGHHLMVIGLGQAFTHGDRFEMVLEFERAGAVTVSVKIESHVEPSGNSGG